MLQAVCRNPYYVHVRTNAVPDRSITGTCTGTGTSRLQLNCGSGGAETDIMHSVAELRRSSYSWVSKVRGRLANEEPSVGAIG